MKAMTSPLLEGVTTQERDAMRKCFGVYEQSFRPEDVIYDFGDGRHMIGIVNSGSADIRRIDERGVCTILEHLESGGVFGEMLMFENTSGDSIAVVCRTACRISFLKERELTKRCENACAFHTRVVENMFHLVAVKATSLSERVEVLSRRSIRDKLLCYFSLQLQGRQDSTFTLPFSLSALADYISTDRSAMMRELKKMRQEQLVTIAGRQVHLSA